MEIQLINIAGVLLGIIAPSMLLYAVSMGVQRTHWSRELKISHWNKILLGVVFWTILVFGLTLNGLFEYAENDQFPRFLIGLLIPVIAGLMLLRSSAFVEILDKIPMHVLVGSQFFRLLGAVFFLVASFGLGPKELVGSGFGDVVTGILAILAALMLYKNFSGAITAAWMFNIMGLLDLVNISRILLTNYPTWSESYPSTAFAGSFPLMLVVGITAPVALLLHVCLFRVLVRTQVTNLVSK